MWSDAAQVDACMALVIGVPWVKGTDADPSASVPFIGGISG